MPAKTIMVQGTASSVGKSVLVAALCRIFRQDGYRVAPFKSQNMALNSFVTREGGEIGRAQAVQAEAAGIEPSVHMNPILLKPEAHSRLQVNVLGQVAPEITAETYSEATASLLPIVKKSLDYLRSQYDIVVIEGAGSAAEVNLRDREIVNMRIASMARSPVLLVGDIDRGGVFASLVGTLELLKAEERDLVKGLIINKFRGDMASFKSGVDFLEARTGKPVLGVIPYFGDIHIAQEDSVYLDERPAGSLGQGPDVAVIQLPHIANYDDFDPLEEMGCHVRYVKEPSRLRRPDLIILPGTKSTIHDRLFLKKQGFDQEILRLVSLGIPIVGICGGYQLLGQTIRDPDHVESSLDSVEGLGLLDIATVFSCAKTTTQVAARVTASAGFFAAVKDMEITGYEIHMGQTERPAVSPLCRVTASPQGVTGYLDGAVSPDGRVWGTYLHGIFQNTAFTAALLKHLRQRRGLESAPGRSLSKDESYDKLAALVRQHLDMERVYGVWR